MKKLVLTGPVSENIGWWDKTINPIEVKRFLDANDEEIEVQINTYGGSFYAGMQIHQLLREYSKTKAKVTTVAMSKVMSSGTHILCAGDTIKAHSTSTIMCHEAWLVTGGSQHEFKKTANMLDGIDGVQANIYAKFQTDKTIKEIRANMRDEMWYIGSEQLLNSGFIDSIIETDEAPTQLNDASTSFTNFKKEYTVKVVEHIDEVATFDDISKEIKACGGECVINGKSERPKDSVNLKNDKGELVITKEELDKLKADYASSQSKVTELSAENERLTAEKESEITALKETHKKELNANSKVFRTVLASGKHFNLDPEMLQANVEKAVEELKTNANYTDGFVSHTVNTLVLANIETDGAFVGGGNDPKNEADGASAIEAWKKQKGAK